VCVCVRERRTFPSREFKDSLSTVQSKVVFIMTRSSLCSLCGCVCVCVYVCIYVRVNIITKQTTIIKTTIIILIIVMILTNR